MKRKIYKVSLIKLLVNVELEKYISSNIMLSFIGFLRILERIFIEMSRIRVSKI